MAVRRANSGCSRSGTACSGIVTTCARLFADGDPDLILKAVRAATLGNSPGWQIKELRLVNERFDLRSFSRLMPAVSRLNRQLETGKATTPDKVDLHAFASA